MTTKDTAARAALRRLVLGATERPGACDSVTVTAHVPAAWWREVRKMVRPPKQAASQGSVTP